MTGKQWTEVSECFDRLSELSEDERNAQIAAIPDEEVRREVQSLLANSGGDARLESAIGSFFRAAGAEGAFQHTVGAGARFGPYRIVRHLGRGGMGDVYEAAREDDFQKRVAIKMVRFGLESEFAQKRFQAERQLLANLEHPYIARLLDGGEVDGSPYLVLEYVEGVPLDIWRQGKPREAALVLFLKVCEGVEYAHRNLVVHRDLKPANILVTPDGAPKLLDFGIAKLIDAGEDSSQTTQFALTPQYASPEQVRGQGIGTSSDVYSLGAVLYELLSGSKPYRVANLSATEIERIVCDTEPPRPGVTDDLDNIILMAMRKEPGRRYGSVRALADDIERSLTFHPVMARPDGALYRARKFARRNRVSLVAGTLVAAALITGAVVSQYQERRAAYRFEQVRQLANKFLFDFDAAIAPLAGATKARELVVNTATEYLNNLAAEAKGDAQLEADLASAYEKLGDVQGSASQSSLGKPKEALASYRRSCDLWARVLDADGGNPRHWKGAAGAEFKKGDLELRVLQGTQAAESFAKGIEYASRGRALAPKDADLTYLEAGGSFRRGDLARGSSPAGAQAHFEKSLELYRQLQTIEPKLRYENAIAITRLRIAQVLLEQFRLNEAIPHAEEALSIRRALVAKNPGVASAKRGVANALGILANAQGVSFNLNLGDFAGARRSLEEAIAIVDGLAQADPADRVAREDRFVMQMQLARVLLYLDPRAALRQARAARAGLGEEKPETLREELLNQWRRTLSIEATALHAMGETAEAFRVLEPLLSQKLDVEFRRSAELLEAELLSRLGRAGDARAVIASVEKSLGVGTAESQSLSALRDQARVENLLAGLDPGGACDHARKEKQLWEEWARRKAPEWYARGRPETIAKRLAACR